MNPENKDTPAFPMLWDSSHNPNLLLTGEGLTKRELFAAMAMQGYMAYEFCPHQNPEHVAEYAVKCADELLKALAK